MSRRFFMTLSDDHGEFLDAVANKKGMTCVQDVIREMIVTAYTKHQKKKKAK